MRETDGVGQATASGADARFMHRALELAEAGWGRVHPNPLVGAVVVRGDAIIGEGAHREFGGPHAEVEALEAAGEGARGATLYVTLEPCAHHGKTPPCTDAIIRHGIRRVVFAAPDPNPDAAGGGAVLSAAGVEVTGGVERERARAQNALFFGPIERGRPLVALKLGLTLDARIAEGPGRRTRVTGAAAEAEVHRLRAGFDAILVGARTARIDDPSLTVRHAAAPRVPPVRVIADPAATLPPEGTLAATAGEVPVVVLASPEAESERVEALRGRGVDVVSVPADGAVLDLASALDRLWDRGIRTVLCEGGGRLAASLLEAGLVDRLYLFYAPKIFGAGGVAGFPGATGFRGGTMTARMVGEDALLTMDRSE